MIAGGGLGPPPVLLGHLVVQYANASYSCSVEKEVVVQLAGLPE
jgi:hypothetical protein